MGTNQKIFALIILNLLIWGLFAFLLINQSNLDCSKCEVKIIQKIPGLSEEKYSEVISVGEIEKALQNGCDKQFRAFEKR